jgi:hypothetical protein
MVPQSNATTVSTPAKVSKARTKANPRQSAKRPAADNSETRSILSLAEAKGLLSGAKTLVVRGRMPVELVTQAKRRTGITSDTKLLEVALASLALTDDYAEWLLAHRGTIAPELDLEF